MLNSAKSHRMFFFFLLLFVVGVRGGTVECLIDTEDEIQAISLGTRTGSSLLTISNSVVTFGVSGGNEDSDILSIETRISSDPLLSGLSVNCTSSEGNSSAWHNFYTNCNQWRVSNSSGYRRPVLNGNGHTIFTPENIYSDDVVTYYGSPNTCFDPPSGHMIDSETMQSQGCVNVSDGDNCTLVCADSENAVSVPGSIVVCNHGSWSNENRCEELGSREYGWSETRCVIFISAFVVPIFLHLFGRLSDLLWVRCSNLNKTPFWFIMFSPAQYANVPILNERRIRSLIIPIREQRDQSCCHQTSCVLTCCDVSSICCGVLAGRFGCQHSDRSTLRWYKCRWIVLCCLACFSLLLSSFTYADLTEVRYWDVKRVVVLGAYSRVDAKNKEIAKWGGFCVGTRPDRSCYCSKDNQYISGCEIAQYAVEWNCSADETPERKERRCVGIYRDFEATMISENEQKAGFSPLDFAPAIGSMIPAWTDCKRPNGACTVRSLGGKGVNEILESITVFAIVTLILLFLFEYIVWLSFEFGYHRNDVTSNEILSEKKIFELTGTSRAKVIDRNSKQNTFSEAWKRTRYPDIFFTSNLDLNLGTGLENEVLKLISNRMDSHWGRVCLYHESYYWTKLRDLCIHKLRRLGTNIAFSSDIVHLIHQRNEVAHKKESSKYEETWSHILTSSAHRESTAFVDKLRENARIAQKSATFGKSMSTVGYGARVWYDIDPNFKPLVEPIRLETRENSSSISCKLNEDDGNDIDSSSIDWTQTINSGRIWVPCEFKMNQGGHGKFVTRVPGIGKKGLTLQNKIESLISSKWNHIVSASKIPLKNKFATIPMIIRSRTIQVLPGGFIVLPWARISSPRHCNLMTGLICVFGRSKVRGGILQLACIQNKDSTMRDACRVNLDESILDETGQIVIFGNPERVWWRISRLETLAPAEMLRQGQKNYPRDIHGRSYSLHGTSSDTFSASKVSKITGQVRVLEVAIFDSWMTSPLDDFRLSLKGVDRSSWRKYRLETSRKVVVHFREFVVESLSRWCFVQRRDPSLMGLSVFRKVANFLCLTPEKIWKYRRRITQELETQEKGFVDEIANGQ